MDADFFGYTNDIEKLKAAINLREAAIKDGWTCEATYPTEALERAARLTKEGFILSVLTRDDTDKPHHFDKQDYKYQVSVSAWAPDGMQVLVPFTYNWETIRDNVNRCKYCGKVVDKTKRVSFAGRSCLECLPEKRKQLEYPSWTL